MDSGINIIDLSLEVLDIIFSELSMTGQIKLGCAHPNLREAFLFHNRSSLKEIDLTIFPSEIWDSLLSLCGYMVESLILESYNLLLAMNCATKHCKSLQKLTFTIDPPDDSYEVIFCLSTLTSLNSICITRGAYSIREYPKVIQCMKLLPNLRKLQLINFSNLALIELRELTQLEELCLHGWDDSIMDIGYYCGTLKKLRVLEIKEAIEYVGSFQALPQCCPLLEKLTLCTLTIEQTPYFPKLKELTIDIKWDPIAHALGECGPRYAKQLDKLTIHTFKPIEEGELLEQLRGIKHFKIKEYGKG